MDEMDTLTDAEYAEVKELHAQLRAAYAANPEAVRQSLKDVAQFPPTGGKL